MFRLVRLSLGRLSAHPVRAALVVLTLALGTAVVALAFALRVSLARLERQTLPDRGVRVAIANGETDADGVWQWEEPRRFVWADGPEIQAQVPEVLYISPYREVGWPSVYASGQSWRLRRTAGVGSEYARIMDLEIVAGTFFTAEDERESARLVVLSESAARTLFGTSVEALDQVLSVSTGMVFMAVRASREGGLPGPGDGEPVEMKESYRVVGVFRDPPRLARETYGIPEALVPHTSTLPPGVALDLPIGVFVALSRDADVERLGDGITAALESTYGDEVLVTVWGGDPGTPRPDGVPDARAEIRRLSVTVSILAMVILLLSGFGVFSALMAEGADTGRETGILRALGASRPVLRLLVVLRAGVLGLVGGCVGVAGAIALRPAIWGVLGELLDGLGVSPAELALTGPRPLAHLAALGLAVAAAAFFGLVPAARTGGVSIVESIRET